MTENGKTDELRFDPIDPWGGFNYILEKAGELMESDSAGGWVIVTEGEGNNRYEQKIFRGWLILRGLCSPKSS